MWAMSNKGTGKFHRLSIIAAIALATLARLVTLGTLA